MIQILKSYLKRLTNLSTRNKSLLLLKDSYEQFLDINELNFLSKNNSYEIVNQLIAGKKNIFLCDEIDPRYEKVNELSKRLARISRTEKFIEQERGSEDLYVGYPFVKGKFLDGTVVRCPLLFFPITLRLEKQKWYITQRDNEPISFNRSFLLAYSHNNNVKINDAFLETSFEDFTSDSLEFRTALYEFLKTSPLVINFNQELFQNELQPFEKTLKSDLEATLKTGELKLYPQIVLGIFPQAGSFLVPDYEHLIESAIYETTDENMDSSLDISGQKLAPIFESKAKIGAVSDVKEEKILSPFAMDASQEHAIKKVHAGQSIVIQGPPGTGKSQLICNLIADFAAAGKKILVVCQKRAALDVVAHRLSTVGFQNFTALIHDFKNDRKPLFDQIAHQIALIDEYKKKNLSLDALWLEQDFIQTSRNVDKIVIELDGFKKALFDTNSCGIAIKNLYLNSKPNGPKINLSNYFKYFTVNNLESFSNHLKSYLNYYKLFEKLNPFWKHRVSFQSFQITDLQYAKNVIADFEIFASEALVFFKENYKKNCNWPLLEQLNNDQHLIKVLLQNIDNERIWQNIQYFLGSPEAFKLLENCANLQHELFSFFNENGLQACSNIHQVSNNYHMAREAKLASESIISWNIYLAFSKNKNHIKSLLSANNLPLNKKGIEILTNKLKNKESLLNWLNINKLIFIKEPETALFEMDLGAFKSHFTTLEKVQKAIGMLSKLTGILYADLKEFDYFQLHAKLKNTVAFVTKIMENQATYNKYFTHAQLDQLLKKDVDYQIISQELHNNFDIFYEADKLKSSFSHTEKAVVDCLIKSEITDKIELFTNSIFLHWIDFIEEKYPILRAVSSLKMGQMEAELIEKIHHKQSLSQQILLLKAREHTYNGLEYNRLQNITTYRGLNHQVTKRKKLWSMRQLFAGFSSEIFDLIPCWLASPETVSAVFPMEPFFDLVIFDEASQCYAESGLPAIYRGKQVVITGDSKQLQPSDLYSLRFEEEADDQPDLEVNSLLDLAIQYLPQTLLHGHYRSKSIDLIDFSNKYFYKNKLQILPHFQHINNNVPNINFVKVEGVFQEGKNITEANEVAKTVKRLKELDPTKSIGIVTFNYHQQNLIQDLLEKEGLYSENSDEKIFVKNIENVQGDERDIIIFSIAYGPDAKGKIKIQFGTLNQAGGENRLNVAITRARNQIYLITSIWPSQLHVDDTLNEGPKLLKKYMDYAMAISEGKYIPQAPVNEPNTNGEFLKDLLIKENKSLSSGLPFADLASKNNSKFEELYLTDDDLYYQSLSSKEAHAYWAINFEKKGWAYKKKYSREYWKNK